MPFFQDKEKAALGLMPVAARTKLGLRTHRTIKDVCGALIEKDGKFLVARRKPDDSFGGLWEFPGGGLEPGERKKQCLEREIKEELGLDVRARRLIRVFQDEIPGLKINVFLFECRIKKGIPRPLDCLDVRWVDLECLKKLKLAQADKKVLSWLLEKRKSGDKSKTKG